MIYCCTVVTLKREYITNYSLEVRLNWINKPAVLVFYTAISLQVTLSLLFVNKQNKPTLASDNA